MPSLFTSAAAVAGRPSHRDVAVIMHAEIARIARDAERSARHAAAWRWAAWVIVLVGVGLRLRQYQSARCLWIDECFLALNLPTRGYAELTRPLDFNQAAPLLFLTAQKTAVLWFGFQELALRLVPLAAGVASLAIFAQVARRLLTPPSACVAIGLFSLSDSLVYYSTEAKQYAVEVLVAVGLLWLGSAWRGRSPSGRQAAIGGGLGAVAILSSFTAPFGLAAAGLGWWLHAPRSRLGRFLLVGGLWAGAFVLCWLALFRHIRNNAYLADYWDFAFAPFPPTSGADLAWYRYALLELLDVYDHRPFAPADLVLIGVGVWAVARKDPPLAFMMWLPLCLTLVASALRLYPFSGRLVLFLTPVIPLALGQGLDALRDRLPGLACLAIGVIMLSPTAYYASRSAVDLQRRCEFRPIHKQLIEDCQPGDVVYLSWHASYLYSFYRHVYGGVREGVEIIEHRDDGAITGLADRLKKAPEIARVWAVHATTVEWRDEAPLLEIDPRVARTLGQWGEYVRTTSERGAAVELYRRGSKP
jgi:hypothetical protein